MAAEIFNFSATAFYGSAIWVWVGKVWTLICNFGSTNISTKTTWHPLNCQIKLQINNRKCDWICMSKGRGWAPTCSLSLSAHHSSYHPSLINQSIKKEKWPLVAHHHVKSSILSKLTKDRIQTFYYLHIYQIISTPET